MKQNVRKSKYDHFDPGVNKKPKKIKTVWHGFRGILKLSGRVNQASLKLSAGFLRFKLLCLTENEKIEAYFVHILFNYQTLYQ